MKKFSVIIVSLNTKKDFLKTINSARKQKYNDYEIIIVDGKSSDGTIKEIKRIKDRRVRSVIEKDNGIYDAMNKGVKKSKGDWIIFLNSGDIFVNKNVFKKISIKEIEKYDILFGNTLVDNKFFIYKVRANSFTKKTIFMPFCHQSTVVRKNLLLNYVFSSKYKISSDFDFFLKCFKKRVRFHNLNITVSKVLSNGLSDRNRNTVFNENIKIIRNNNYDLFLIFKLFINKIFNFIKNLIKFVFPNWLILLILKIKYKSSKY